MRYELFIYDGETEELIHQQQADKVGVLINHLIKSKQEHQPWVIMQKHDFGGSWEKYWGQHGGPDIYYKKIMEE